MSVIPMPTIAEWRLATCGSDCRRERGTEIHDPRAHELAGQRAALRMLSKVPGSVRTGGIEIDYAMQRVMVDGTDARLTPVQWRVLAYLGKHVGEICSHEQIVVGVWGADELPVARQKVGYRGTRWHTLIVTLSRARTKLGPWGRLVVTRPRLGYGMLIEEVRP